MLGSVDGRADHKRCGVSFPVSRGGGLSIGMIGEDKEGGAWAEGMQSRSLERGSTELNLARLLRCHHILPIRGEVRLGNAGPCLKGGSGQ